MTLLNGSLNILGTATLPQQENYWFLFFLLSGSGVVFLIFYYFSRFHNIYQSLYWPFNFVLLLFLSVNILGNAGSQGSTFYYMIAAVVISVMLVHRPVYYFILPFFYGAFLAAILYVEKNHPGLIIPYPTAEERLMDVYGNLFGVQLLIGVMVLILARNLNQEVQKSDKLILNILPEELADELKVNDSVRPRSYKNATILFTDFVGFTEIAARLTPEELVAELDDYFRGFDAVMRNCGLEKIKTIGDAYMAVGGIPEENTSHPVDAVRAGLMIRELVMKKAQEREVEGRPGFKIRIGIHTGPLVAGVVGDDKIAYDVWGDTVNIASRHESAANVGEVNISGETYELIKEYFICESRGQIAMKNRGEGEMYFVRGARTELADETGRLPGVGFAKLYEERFAQ